MPAPTQIENVPSSKVGEEVQSAIDTGASKIECIKADDDSWTINIT